eukprot:403353067
MNIRQDLNFTISTQPNHKSVVNRKTQILKYISGAALLVVAGTLAVVNYKQDLFVESQVQFADFNPQVPAGHAVFWWDAGFKGRTFEMQLGGMQEAQLYNMGWNDKLSSFQIGEGVRAKICKHKNCKDESHWDTVLDILGPYNAAQMFDGTNDWASHIWIFPYNPQTEKYVQLFSGQNFDVSHAGIFSVGQYDSDDIKHHHVDKGGYKGAASSMIVPDGLTVTLFKNDYYNGEQLTIQGPKRMDFVSGEVQGWNDQIRSLRVIQTSKMNVNTYWERVISSNGPITETIEVGWSKEESKTDETTVTNSFTTSAEEGYSFMGSSSKVTLSYTLSTSIRNSVTQSLSISKRIQKTVSCNNPNNELVTLYQWVLNGERIGEPNIKVDDSNFICRYGVNANSSPACPLTMCADSQCNTCTGPLNLHQ